MKQRCSWVGDYPEYIKYHDVEWGVPVFDDKVLFEFIILEGAQAGLSWLTILKRRVCYKKAFANFDVKRVAKFDPSKVQKLTADPGIIRNKLKIRSAINNAKRFIAVQQEFGSFSNYQYQFVGGKPKQNIWTKGSQIPAVTPDAEAFSKDLKKRGFSFVGPTIIYSYMQAVGMVNDHVTSCFRYKEIKSLKI